MLETEQDPVIHAPPPLHPLHLVLCLRFVCGKFQLKSNFNQRNEKCSNKGEQSEETK